MGRGQRRVQRLLEERLRQPSCRLRREGWRRFGDAQPQRLGDDSAQRDSVVVHLGAGSSPTGAFEPVTELGYVFPLSVFPTSETEKPEPFARTNRSLSKPETTRAAYPPSPNAASSSARSSGRRRRATNPSPPPPRSPPRARSGSPHRAARKRTRQTAQCLWTHRRVVRRTSPRRSLRAARRKYAV